MAKDIVDSKKLNKEQLEAVKHKKGPLLIIAGAGTGKTTVITERIKYLIKKELAKPSEILALTFTGKAAREMEERVDIAMPYGYTQMWISTFHSFCDRLLRDEALHIGLDPKYKLMAQAETIQLIRSHLFDFELDYFRPRGNPTKFVGGVLQHFSRLQDEDVTPKEYLKWANKEKTRLRRGSGEAREELRKWLELAKAYKKYDELKVKEGIFDFGDLIVKTLELFRRRPNILKQYQKQFKYILVDEFQDTNYAQNELAILLAGRGKSANITVTGDDDQSIYRFRGAAVSNIIQFRKSYPKAKIVVLTRNYRSRQEILDKAYQLIQHNNPDRLEAVEKIDKKLVAQRKKVDGEIAFVHRDRVENEAEETARKIRELVSEGSDWSDIAILVRANNHSEPFIRAFSRNAIPYQFLGPGRLFRQSEVIDLISYLKVLYDFEDNVALYRVLSHDYFGIPSQDLIKISNYARRLNLTLFEATERLSDPSTGPSATSSGQGIYVSEKTKKTVKKVLKIIKRHMGLIKKETAGQILYYFLQDSGLLQKLLNPDTQDAEKKAQNISKFFDKLKTYEVDHEDATVTAVVDWIELASELGESPLAADIDWTDVNAVSILTVHSAKGLEFRVVFLVNLVSARFPTIERREKIPIPEALIKEILPEGDYHEQEERRLFYVGMTRAMDNLYFTAADYYGEGKREKRLSPFIFEALGDEVIATESFGDAQDRQLSFIDYEPKAKPFEALAKEGQPALHIDYLSYSQIETFRICPLHYKLKYIFKIPVPPSAAQSFGTSVHAALRDFYKSAIAGGKISAKLMGKVLREVWIPEGYKGKSHEKRSYEAAKKYLVNYYKKEFDPKSLPVALEQPFVVPLDAEKGEKRLKIGGKIDRVDSLKPSSAKASEGRGIEIIDYKTGANVPTQRQIDHDLQLTFYALAATKINESPFNKKPEDLVLSLYYFDNQKKVSTKRTNKQLREATKEIFEWREKIEKSDFKCSGHIFCENCEYSLMCRAD